MHHTRPYLAQLPPTYWFLHAVVAFVVVLVRYSYTCFAFVWLALLFSFLRLFLFVLACVSAAR